MGKARFEESFRTEEFFRNRHEPHVAYEKARETLQGTMLKPHSDTRWTYQVACVGSLLKNRQVIENAVLQLRAQKYAFKWSELMWIWKTDWASTRLWPMQSQHMGAVRTLLEHPPGLHKALLKCRTVWRRASTPREKTRAF